MNARHFGDLNDPNSAVSKILSSTKYYRLLEEANTEPQIYYVFFGVKWVKEGE